jgi:uncharacterized membrane protein YuzA (DUF378 family)
MFALGVLGQLCGEEFRMLDVIYILIGAAFLGGCVLYAIACDHM